MTKIERCRSCGSENLKALLSLGDQYLSDFRSDNKLPAKYPLDLILCENCFLVQLKHTAPQSSLYTENYGYKSGVNGTIKADLKDIVQKASKEVDLKSHERWLDQGSNDCELLSNVPMHILKVGVEPIKKFAKEYPKYNAKLLNDFWNYEIYAKRFGKTPAKVITTISCFYDMDDPNAFVSDTVKALAKNGVWIIQQNYLVGMLKQNAYDNIVHEHLEYYSLLSLENLLNKYGVEVYKVEENNINGGSFRTYICHKGKRKIDRSVKKMREEEKKLALNTIHPYVSFARRVERLAGELNLLITRLVAEEKKIYLYGASTRSGTMLQYSGMDNKLITAAVERNPEKWGKKIASLQIPIISEEYARRIPCDYGLLALWYFSDEIVKREEEFLKQSHHFIIPLPELRII